MNSYESFLKQIQQRTTLASPQEAENALIATFDTFYERLSQGQVDSVIEQLPPELSQGLRGKVTKPANTNPVSFPLDEFVNRVASREGTGQVQGRKHVQAVLDVLIGLIPPQEVHKLHSQLSPDYQDVLPLYGQQTEDTSGNLVERVQRHMDSGTRQATKAIHATLQTLAERISIGQMEDLLREIPDDFYVSLEEKGHARAHNFNCSDFILRVSKREGGIPVKDAEQHARAVFKALQEIVSKKEMDDVRMQLDRDYNDILSGCGPR